MWEQVALRTTFYLPAVILKPCSLEPSILLGSSFAAKRSFQGRPREAVSTMLQRWRGRAALLHKLGLSAHCDSYTPTDACLVEAPCSFWGILTNHNQDLPKYRQLLTCPPQGRSRPPLHCDKRRPSLCPRGSCGTLITPQFISSQRTNRKW